MKSVAVTQIVKSLGRVSTLSCRVAIHGILKHTKLICSLVHCVRGVAGYKCVLECLLQMNNHSVLLTGLCCSDNIIVSYTLNKYQ